MIPSEVLDSILDIFDELEEYGEVMVLDEEAAEFSIMFGQSWFLDWARRRRIDPNQLWVRDTDQAWVIYHAG